MTTSGVFRGNCASGHSRRRILMPRIARGPGNARRECQRGLSRGGRPGGCGGRGATPPPRSRVRGQQSGAGRSALAQPRKGERPTLRRDSRSASGGWPRVGRCGTDPRDRGHGGSTRREGSQTSSGVRVGIRPAGERADAAVRRRYRGVRTPLGSREAQAGREHDSRAHDLADRSVPPVREAHGCLPSWAYAVSALDGPGCLYR